MSEPVDIVAEYKQRTDAINRATIEIGRLRMRDAVGSVLIGDLVDALDRIRRELGYEDTNTARLFERADLFTDEPVDVVAEMRNQQMDFLRTVYVHRDTLDGWATELERLQVLPEQIKRLAEKWLRERNNLRDGQAWLQGYRNGLSSCHRELLALLNPQTGDSNE